MWNNLDKSDKNFILRCLIIGIVVILLLTCFDSFLSKIYKNIIGYIGTIFTLIALLFSIFQQNKLRTTANEIKENAENLYRRLRKDLENITYTKALESITEIENSLTSREYQLTKMHYKYLMDTLEEYKKIEYIETDSEIEKIIQAKGNLTIADYTRIRSQKEIEMKKKLKNAIKRCSRQYLDICKLINEEKTEDTTNLEVDNIVNLRNLLRECRPHLLSTYK